MERNFGGHVARSEILSNFFFSSSNRDDLNGLRVFDAIA